MSLVNSTLTTSPRSWHYQSMHYAHTYYVPTKNVSRASSVPRSLNRSAGISETALLESSITDSLLASGERESESETNEKIMVIFLTHKSFSSPSQCLTSSHSPLEGLYVARVVLEWYGALCDHLLKERRLGEKRWRWIQGRAQSMCVILLTFLLLSSSELA